MGLGMSATDDVLRRTNTQGICSYSIEQTNQPCSVLLMCLSKSMHWYCLIVHTVDSPVIKTVGRKFNRTVLGSWCSQSNAGNWDVAQYCKLWKNILCCFLFFTFFAPVFLSLILIVTYHIFVTFCRSPSLHLPSPLVPSPSLTCTLFLHLSFSLSTHLSLSLFPCISLPGSPSLASQPSLRPSL